MPRDHPSYPPLASAFGRPPVRGPQVSFEFFPPKSAEMEAKLWSAIRRLEPTMPPMTAEERDAMPPVTHPVIRVHPDRGYRRSLYFTSNTSLEIGGMTLEEGKVLHRWLVDYVSRPEFCYFHRWRPNDLVMWDNRVLLHRAIEYDYARPRRVLRRTTVAGGGPVMGPFWPEAREAAGG